MVNRYNGRAGWEQIGSWFYTLIDCVKDLEEELESRIEVLFNRERGDNGLFITLVPKLL